MSVSKVRLHRRKDEPGVGRVLQHYVHRRLQFAHEPQGELRREGLLKLFWDRFHLALHDLELGAARLPLALDTRGPRPQNLVPSGTLADYVSGTSGEGDVRLRIHCTKSFSSFYLSADLVSSGSPRQQFSPT
jgi:hypothetical protein